MFFSTFSFFWLFVAQGHDGIDSRRAVRRDHACGERHDDQRRSCAGVNKRSCGRHAK
jgi:hypothetical protein